VKPPVLVLSVVGARPNFIKLAPVARALGKRQIRHVIVHTGQHYDVDMSDAFFRDLEIPEPDFNLAVGSGSHGQQTAAVMERLEPLCCELRPDVVLVYGDVNSTAAAALVAAKLSLPLGHVEAGLRSRDRTMPEEINRIVADRLSDILFAPSRDGYENLLGEGIPARRIQFVGNIMIDSLVRALPAARQLDASKRRGVRRGEYAVVTLHRPSNVDEPGVLKELLHALSDIAADRPVLFPVHPRTRRRMSAVGFRAGTGVRAFEPVPYLEMLSLVMSAGLVVTDSGGLQEETTFLGIPCLTVRPNTERPITCTEGTNRLVPPHRDAIVSAARAALARTASAAPTIERWDGTAGERIAAVLCDGARFD
jgi:UDP-N-acetylglucosamine 2-epimerase (non-hydrolysing)